MKYLVPQEIETARILLRPFKSDDLKGMCRHYSDSVATQYTIGRTLDKADTWHILAAMIGHWELKKYGPFAMELKENGEFIGVTGFWFPVYWPEAEIKWALLPDYWKRGLAREGAKAVLETAKNCMPDLPLISLIREENAASIKVAESIGAHFEKEIIMFDCSHLVYRY